MKYDARPKARQFIKETWQRQANLSVFLILLATSVFVLPVLAGQQRNFNLYATVVSTLLLIAGFGMGWGRPKLFFAALVVGTPTLAVRWAYYLHPGHQIELWAEILTLLTVLVIGYVLLAQVFREGPIDEVRVQGAVAAYLLMGVGYAHAYRIAEYFNPNAITSTEGRMSSFVDWIYYSFSTLSTLGYGDIIPTGHTSRMLAIGEAISGQLFLAILVARLVAMQVGGPPESSQR